MQWGRTKIYTSHVSPIHAKKSEMQGETELENGSKCRLQSTVARPGINIECARSTCAGWPRSNPGLLIMIVCFLTITLLEFSDNIQGVQKKRN